MAAQHVTLVLAKFAQGVHILARDEEPSVVMVDHLPANIDLINSYSAIGQRRRTVGVLG